MKTCGISWFQLILSPFNFILVRKFTSKYFTISYKPDDIRNWWPLGSGWWRERLRLAGITLVWCYKNVSEDLLASLRFFYYIEGKNSSKVNPFVPSGPFLFPKGGRERVHWEWMGEGKRRKNNIWIRITVLMSFWLSLDKFNLRFSRIVKHRWWRVFTKKVTS